MQLTEQIVSPVTQDPVCGRHMDEERALLSAEYKGRRYLFCSERCRMLFALRPESFAVEEDQPEEAETPAR
jgi:YHS domain-containing protein